MKYIAKCLLCIGVSVFAGCSGRRIDVPIEVVRSVIATFEKDIFQGDLNATFNSWYPENSIRVDSIHSIEIHVDRGRDYYILQFRPGYKYYEDVHELPNGLYQTRQYLYTIFDGDERPSADVMARLKENGLIQGHAKIPMMWIEEDIKLHYYFVCRDDTRIMKYQSAESTIQRDQLPDSVCQ